MAQTQINNDTSPICNVRCSFLESSSTFSCSASSFFVMLTSLHSIVMMKIAWDLELCSFISVALKNNSIFLTSKTFKVEYRQEVRNCMVHIYVYKKIKKILYVCVATTCIS